MIGVLCFTLIAFVLSVIIVFFFFFLFKRRRKVDIIEQMLPGYNCGMCGFGSCLGMAVKLLSDSSLINNCKICKNKDEIIKYLGDDKNGKK